MGKTLKGFAIVNGENDLGYGAYTYFVKTEWEAECILSDVINENPDMRIIPATLILDEIAS